MSSPQIPLEELLSNGKITQSTFEKVQMAKSYIEKKYNMKIVKNLEWNVIMEKVNSLNIPEAQKEQIKFELCQQENTRLRKIRDKITVYDYESLGIIGRGAFGEVHVCRHKKTKEIVAIKKIKKDTIQKKNQLKHIRDEQEFMRKVKSQWIVELKYSFQEGDFLFLVMEFLPGGDLMSLLIEKDIFTEEEAKFYIAEIILAVESLHKLDCIHRDIKPDNILIDSTGHLKLSDFGLAKLPDNFFDVSVMVNNQQKHSRRTFSCVGTALYAAPEIFHRKNYNQGIDWWSVGIIFYEMIVGYAPFCAKDSNEVMNRIMNFTKYFKIPSKVKISANATDLIKKMITDADIRLGNKGAEEIKNHPFFNGINWGKLREAKAPFVPKLKTPYDTCYFESFNEIESFYPPLNSKKRKDPEYIGYTYRGEDCVQTDLIKAIEMIETLKLSTSKTNISTESNSNPKLDDIGLLNNTGSVKYMITEPDLPPNHAKNFNELPDTNTNKDKPKLQIIQLPKALKSDNSSNGSSDNNSNSNSQCIKNNNANIITFPKQTQPQSTKHSENKKNNDGTDVPAAKSGRNKFFDGLMSMKKSISFKINREKSKSPKK